MASLKPINCHGSTANIYNYLHKENRAIDMELYNLSELSDKIWHEQMEYTRELYDNNKPHGKKPAVTYYHFILSPHPIDSVNLEQMKEIANTWREAVVGENYEVAIVYHNDSDLGTIHAHLVINNTNLDTGNRFQLSNAANRASRDILQQICKERGLRHFMTAEEEQELKAQSELINDQIARTGMHQPIKVDPLITREPRVNAILAGQECVPTKTRSKLPHKALIDRREFSWLSDLKARVQAAADISNTRTEFVAACEAAGVKVSSAATGDFLFTHPERPSWKAQGRKLDPSLEKSRLTANLSVKSRSNRAVSARYRTNCLSEIGDAVRLHPNRDISLIYVGKLTAGLTLKDYAAALRINAAYNIKSPADYGKLLADPKTGENAAAQLRWAKQVAAKTNMYFTPAGENTTPTLEEQKQAELKAIPAVKTTDSTGKPLTPEQIKRKEIQAIVAKRKIEAKYKSSNYYKKTKRKATRQTSDTPQAHTQSAPQTQRRDNFTR